MLTLRRAVTGHLSPVAALNRAATAFAKPQTNFQLQRFSSSSGTVTNLLASQGNPNKSGSSKSLSKLQIAFAAALLAVSG